MKQRILIASQILIAAVAFLIIFFLWTGSETGESEFVPADEKIVIYRYNWGEVASVEADIIWSEIRKQLPENLNIDLHVESIPGTEYGQRLAVDLSIGEQIDAFLIGENDLGYWYSQGGIIEPVNYLLDSFGPHVIEAVPPEAWNQVSIGDTILGIPSIGDPGGNCIVVRKDILDRYGIPLPTTLAELEEASRRLLEYDSSIIPITGAWWDFSYLLCPALGIPRWDENIIDHEREMIYSGNKTVEFRHYFRILQEWRRKGFLDPNFISADFNATKKLFLSGQNVFTFNHVERTHDWGAELADIVPEAELAVIPELDGAGVWSGSGIVPSVLLITQYSTQKENLVKYLDWMLSSAGNYRLAAFGLPDRHYTPDGADAFIQHEEILYANLFAPIHHRELGLTCSNRFPAWYPAIERVNSVEYHSDPLKGVLFLDTSTAKRFPATSLFDQEAGKFLDGRLEATRENYQKLVDIYFMNGGTEISREYYTQYREVTEGR